MPSKGVNVVILNTDQTRVLLQKREDFRVWGVPGGSLEPGESPEEAAMRETYEETGYRIEIDRYVGEYWRPQMPNGGATMLAFTGHVIGGSPDERGWESVAVGWFEPQDLPSRTVSFSRDVIADALSDHREPLKRTQRLPLWQISLLRVGFVLRAFRNRLLGRA